MGDEFLRIGGRGDDGTAKAVKTDNDGNIGVHKASAEEIILFDAVNGSIRDTTLSNKIVLKDVFYKYNEFELVASNSLDVPFFITITNSFGEGQHITVSPKDPVDERITATTSWSNTGLRIEIRNGLNNVNAFLLPLKTGDGTRYYPMHKNYIRDFGDDIMFRIKCVVAPTVGNASLKLVCRQ